MCKKKYAINQYMVRSGLMQEMHDEVEPKKYAINQYLIRSCLLKEMHDEVELVAFAKTMRGVNLMLHSFSVIKERPW